jgi:hypothetical protein
MPKICYVPRNFDKIGTRLTTLAEQIINEYSKQGFDLTLRQLYYQFVARDLLPDKWADKTTGSKNNQRSYSNLGSLINNARLAGLIDWYAIVDRTRGLVKNSHWDNPAEIVDQCAQSYQIDKWAEQETRVELWIEKDALAGIVDSVCRSLDIPYFSCRGYTSQSEMWIGAMRLRRQIKNGQGVIVLHLGDHDPSGIDMTRDITDRISLFTAGEDVEIKRIALNMNQIEQYNLPPNPAKVTDSRAKEYIANYGEESWELDALDPAVIAELITDHVLEVRDDSLWEAAVEKENEGKNILQEFTETLGR